MDTNNKDINFDEGLELFGGNNKMYVEVLKSVYEESNDKIAGMKKALAGKDYTNYKILVHGVASVMGSVGAVEFMNYARTQEHAAANGEIEVVEANADMILKRYENILEAIKSYIG